MKLKIIAQTETTITFETGPSFFAALRRERIHRLVLAGARRRIGARS